MSVTLQCRVRCRGPRELSFLRDFIVHSPDAAQFARITTRLVFAALIGAVVGIQRERVGKPAGLRTHMLVALGAALFVVAGRESGMSGADMSRILQGICAGIGFIGAEAILKNERVEEVTGLTTAAGNV